MIWRAVLFSILMMLGGARLAQPAEDRAAEEAERLREIERQRLENAAAAAELRNRTQAAEEALQSLQGQLVEIADKLQQDEARLTDVERRLARLEEEEKVASVDLRAKQEALSKVFAALQSLERSRPPALAVSPDDATEAAVAAATLASVTPDLRERADRLRTELQRIDELRRLQQRERQTLIEAEASLSERRSLLQRLLAEREAAQRQDTQRLRRIEAEDVRLAREATNLRDLIAGIEARGEAILPAASQAIVGAPAVYAALPELFSDARSLLPLPAAGRVQSFFNDRLPGGQRAREMAVDTRNGAVVTAPFRGRIAFAKPFGRLGNVVILDVGEGYKLILSGLGDLEVRAGELVQAGEPLGTMAEVDPNLLRFQLRRDNVPIDPLPWLRASGTAQNRR